MRTTKEEIKVLIILTKSIYQHWEVNSALVDVWTSVLGRYDVATLNNALRIYLSCDHEFPPKPGQLVELCERMTLKTLTASPQSALVDKNPLAKVAMEKANRQCPFDDKAQFKSIEDLEQAKRIHAFRVQKAFEANYQNMCDTARTFVRFSDCTEEQAIQMTLENHGIKSLTNQINVLSLVKSTVDAKEKTAV